jgi:DMSO/TMAO reductase YedYZ molybdopterin-dependent catalytic subunit
MSGPVERDPVAAMLARRRLLLGAAAGTVVSALGGLWVLTDSTAHASRPDGRPRVPPGQRVIEALRPMGGEEGDPNRSKLRLRVHGDVERPFTIDLRELLALPQVEQHSDVHCVTAWTVLGAKWTGVRVSELARRAGLRASARHVIFEAAHGYTANVRLDEAMKDDVLVAHRLDDQPLARAHGAPLRALVPDLYFWKSPKWLTGIRFAQRDEPGYWERRGYHNHADPWLEERHAPSSWFGG